MEVLLQDLKMKMMHQSAVYVASQNNRSTILLDMSLNDATIIKGAVGEIEKRVDVL